MLQHTTAEVLLAILLGAGSPVPSVDAGLPSAEPRERHLSRVGQSFWAKGQPFQDKPLTGGTFFRVQGTESFVVQSLLPTGDPHGAIRAPEPWYEVRLRSGRTGYIAAADLESALRNRVSGGSFGIYLEDPGTEPAPRTGLP